jgi:hypothetical protein
VTTADYREVGSGRGAARAASRVSARCLRPADNAGTVIVAPARPARRRKVGSLLGSAHRSSATEAGGAAVEDAAAEYERFLVGVLGEAAVDALIQAMLDIAVAPADLSHASWPLLTGLRDRALGVLRADLAGRTEHERQALRDRMPWHLQDERADLASAILEMATRRRYFAVPCSVFGPPGPDSRVLLHIPSLKERTDDDGLIWCAGLDAQHQGLFIGNYAVHYHQFLRRAFSGNINDTLLRVVIEAGMRPGNSFRIAIDDRRLVPRHEFVHFIEEDFWWGPNLTSSWLDDRYTGGCTVHADPEGDTALRGYSKFFAYWRMDGEGSKVVQMEELVTPSAEQLCGYRVLRYLHSIRDIGNHVFTHCDGAVRAYDAEGFSKRQAENMPAGTRAAKYRKVFRVDGAISTGEWSDIVAKWFRHNQLASEYLETLAGE